MFIAIIITIIIFTTTFFLYHYGWYLFTILEYNAVGIFLNLRILLNIFHSKITYSIS